jgi:tetratricopeptide (TPR) repeat protein
VRDRRQLPPNNQLSDARRRLLSPSGSGRVMSRQELADAVNAYLWKEHNQKVSLDANYVGKLERGEHRWPSGLYRKAFRAVLDASSDTELGFYVVRSERQEPGSDRPRRGRLSLVVSSPSEVTELLAHLRDHWHLLVKTDNLLGPRHALTGVNTQLGVLKDLMSADLGELRRETVQLAAQYAESAAWLHEDAGDLTQARFWTGQAMEWAYEINDGIMIAWTAYRRSQQLTATGETSQAIGLARAARRDEDRLPPPMRAAVRVQEAQALAMNGDERAAQQLLDEAHRWAAEDREGDARGGHGSFCTASYIEIHRAGCLRLLHRPQQAVIHFNEALPALPSVYRRDRAAALAGKAAAHAAAGEPDIAAATAHAALPIARRAGSLRIVRQIAAVGATLTPHRRLEPVAALLAELAESGA